MGACIANSNLSGTTESTGNKKTDVLSSLVKMLIFFHFVVIFALIIYNRL